MTPEDALPPARRGSRRLILVIVALLAIGGTATALVWNYAYPSHGPGAVVVFHIGRTTPMFLPSRGEVVRDDFEEFREAQAALVRSRRVLNSAINDPEVRTTELILEADPDPVTWLEANLSVSFGESRSLMRVELDGENTAEAIIVLNAVAKAYLNATSERDHTARIGRLSELERAYQECRKEVEHARLDLYRLEEVSGGKSYGSLVHIRSEEEFAEEVKVAKSELRRVRLERALLEVNPPPADDLPLPPRIAVGGGAIVASDVGQVTISRSRVRVLKELAVREQFWINEIKDAQETISSRSRHSIEIQRLRSQIEPKSELLKRLEDEIERCRLDHRSASRVSMAEEPFARPRHR